MHVWLQVHLVRRIGRMRCSIPHANHFNVFLHSSKVDAVCVSGMCDFIRHNMQSQLCSEPCSGFEHGLEAFDKQVHVEQLNNWRSDYHTGHGQLIRAPCTQVSDQRLSPLPDMVCGNLFMACVTIPLCHPLKVQAKLRILLWSPFSCKI